MKFERFSLIILILSLLFLTGTVSAVDVNDTDINDDYLNLQLNNTENTLSEDFNTIYVDNENGDDLYDGKSQSTSVQTFNRALTLSKDNDSIRLSDGVYTGVKNTKISITKSLTIIGSANTVFDGEGINNIFTINDNVKITFKNIKFTNAYKITSYNNHSSMYGGALDIKNAEVLIENCYFINNTVDFESSFNKFNYGGAISNFGDLTIINSYFNNNIVASTSGLFGYGGSIYNKGKLLLNSTTFTNNTLPVFNFGGVIYNDGEIVMDKSVISKSSSAQESKGSVIYNAGEFILTNSIIENNNASRASFQYIYGTIYNYGTFTGYSNIFKNNTGNYDPPNPEYRGSPVIFNVGTLNLTYNVFVDNAPFNGIASDVYLNGGTVLSLDDNWWSTNDDPYLKNKINVAEQVKSWFVLNLSPEYTPISIGESVDINAFWSLSSTLTPKISLLPVLDINFETCGVNVVKKLTDGQTSFNFNYSQSKGLYPIVASIGEFADKVLVDVGKLNSNIQVNVPTDVIYTDEIILTVKVTAADGNVPTGNVSVIFGKKSYTINLTNGQGLLNLSNLDPDNYNFKIVYEGNDNYFKAFDYVNVTVNKAPTILNITFPDIYVDQKGSVTVNLGPKGVQGQAYLLIDGVRKKVLYLYNGQTTVAISNFAEGEYNVTVEFWGTKYYEATSASTTFKVSKYLTSLNVTANDINMGENQTMSIQVNPQGLRGEAILNINGVNRTIFLDSDITNITISNLDYGAYDIWVYFPENQKYYSSNVSDSFKVLRTLTKLNVTIIEDGFNGTMIVKTNYTDCTGSIGVYVNFRLYYADLENGMAKVNVTFDKGTNYIYVFYDGDSNYEASTWNTTLGVAEEFILIGLNTTGFEYNDFNYTIHLIENTGIPMPNRVVSVIFNKTEYNITTNQDGIAYLPLNLEKGYYEISATYKNQTVTNALNIREIKFNITLKNITYGENQTIQVDFDGNLTGNANILIEGILNKTIEIKDGKAVIIISDLTVEAYEVNVKYINGYFTSPAQTRAFEVKKADPAIISDINDLVYGEEGQIGVILPETATGNVTFIVDGVRQTKEVINNTAYITLENLEKATHNVTVIYNGDSNYNSATLNTTFNVKDAYSCIVMLINDSSYGEKITVTAILNQTATGNITFTVSNLTQTLEIKNGIAEWTFTGLNAGKYTVNANYHGDRTFISSKNSTSFNVFKANSTIELFVDEVYLGENILIYAKVSDNATGSVSFSITNYYSPRQKAISGSYAVWYISPLNTGNYTINAEYAGDNNYYASNTTYNLNITQRKAILTVDIPDAGSNDRVTVKIKLVAGDGEAITGSIVLTVNTRSYNVNVNAGSATFVIGRMAIGNYQYNAIYTGNEEFSKSTSSGEFKVVDGLLNLTLTAKNVSCFYGAGKNFVVNVADDSNTPLSDIDLIVKIAGKSYSLTTDSKGQISIPISLDVGKHNVEVIFNENSKYNSAKTTATIEILSTIEGIDVVSLYNTTAVYFVILTDSNGRALANKDVKLIVGSNSYTVKTFPNGIARVNINFKPGNYTLTAVNPVTGQKINNNLFIFLKLMENKDIVKYYGNAQVYKVRAYDDNGKPVGAGKIVTIKVNGKSYNVKTDKYGFATLKVNLKPKSYTITASFDGFKVSNKIKVKPVLTAKNIKVKKGKTIKFRAKLVNKNGKALKGKKITFKFKGKSYKVKTNKKGVAVLKLKLKLKVGKYKIKVKYGKSSLKKTIKIKK